MLANEILHLAAELFGAYIESAEGASRATMFARCDAAKRQERISPSPPKESKSNTTCSLLLFHSSLFTLHFSLNSKSLGRVWMELGQMFN